jgi:hypothetical protein
MLFEPEHPLRRVLADDDDGDERATLSEVARSFDDNLLGELYSMDSEEVEEVRARLEAFVDGTYDWREMSAGPLEQRLDEMGFAAHPIAPALASRGYRRLRNSCEVLELETIGEFARALESAELEATHGVGPATRDQAFALLERILDGKHPRVPSRSTESLSDRQKRYRRLAGELAGDTRPLDDVLWSDDPAREALEALEITTVEGAVDALVADELLACSGVGPATLAPLIGRLEELAGLIAPWRQRAPGSLTRRLAERDLASSPIEGLGTRLTPLLERACRQLELTTLGDLSRALEADVLARIPGIGPQTAERVRKMLLELDAPPDSRPRLPGAQASEALARAGVGSLPVEPLEPIMGEKLRDVLIEELGCRTLADIAAAIDSKQFRTRRGIGPRRRQRASDMLEAACRFAGTLDSTGHKDTRLEDASSRQPRSVDLVCRLPDATLFETEGRAQASPPQRLEELLDDPPPLRLIWPAVPTAQLCERLAASPSFDLLMPLWVFFEIEDHASARSDGPYREVVDLLQRHRTSVRFLRTERTVAPLIISPQRAACGPSPPNTATSTATDRGRRAALGPELFAESDTSIYRYLRRWFDQLWSMCAPNRSTLETSTST